MLDYSLFKGKKILITGATGLIGQAIVKNLLDTLKDEVTIIAVVRNSEKAKKIFNSYNACNIQFLVGDVCDLQAENLSVDYIIHTASMTSSRDFVEKPVDVICSVLNGTKAVLEFARKNPIKAFVYLSTMEVYGAPETDNKIFENAETNLNSMAVRSCYPESKRLAECLCTSYLKQYSIPTKVVRLTQTFGEGVEYNDNRVFAEFSRCVIESRNIVLKTKGETKRSYLYVGDSVSAILTVLLKGRVGEAYNVANEETYCSIFEMANMVAERLGGGIKVIVDESSNSASLGYAPTLKMNLDTTKLKELGWCATLNLIETFEKMTTYMKENKQ